MNDTQTTAMKIIITKDKPGFQWGLFFFLIVPCIIVFIGMSALIGYTINEEEKERLQNMKSKSHLMLKVRE